MSSPKVSSPEVSSLKVSSPETSSHDETPHHSTNDRPVYMANQIGNFFTSQDADEAPAMIAEHIVKFWDPRMRRAIVAHLDAGGAGLDPAARQAIEAVRART
jgi:formate dehydrogenase subunit delta